MAGLTARFLFAPRLPRAGLVVASIVGAPDYDVGILAFGNSKPGQIGVELRPAFNGGNEDVLTSCQSFAERGSRVTDREASGHDPEIRTAYLGLDARGTMPILAWMRAILE
jgi:hypothetical protein